ncbi:MAG: hypothetical protein AAGC71_15225 [Pseudomonadota bacterium]
MRRLLLFIGYASIVGSIGDGALGLYALAKTTCCGSEPLHLTVNDLLQQHIPILYWIKQLAYWVLPSRIVDWVFGLPALVYFPVRVVTSAIIGLWAFKQAEKLSQQEPAA